MISIPNQPRGALCAQNLVVLLALVAQAAWSQNTDALAALPSAHFHDAAMRTASRQAGTETDGLILKLQDNVKKAPENFSVYDNLGAAYFQKARESGDIGYYNLANRR